MLVLLHVIYQGMDVARHILEMSVKKSCPDAGKADSYEAKTSTVVKSYKCQRFINFYISHFNHCVSWFSSIEILSKASKVISIFFFKKNNHLSLLDIG